MHAAHARTHVFPRVGVCMCVRACACVRACVRLFPGWAATFWGHMTAGVAGGDDLRVSVGVRANVRACDSLDAFPLHPLYKVCVGGGIARICA